MLPEIVWYTSRRALGIKNSELADGAGRQALRKAQTNIQETYRIARDEAVAEAAREIPLVRMTYGFWACFLLAIYLAIEVQTMVVLHATDRKACEMHLWGWMSTHVALSFSCLIVGKLPTNFLRIMWAFCGYGALMHVKTCDVTSPALIDWYQKILCIDLMWVFMITCLKISHPFAAPFFLFLVKQGMISNPKAARREVVPQLESVQFDETMVKGGADTREKRLARECCCCYEKFSPYRPIVKTPCGHYFHKKCISDWLYLAKPCPQCQCDLDYAVCGSHMNPGRA